MNVVDEHHRVLDLEILQTTVGGTLINFDSHPDMGLPEAEAESIDIGTWIVPKLMDGTFARVVYVTLFGHAPCGTFRVSLWKDDDGYHIADPDGRLPAWWRAYWDLDADTVPASSTSICKSITVVNLKDALPVLRGVEGPVVVSVDLDFFDVKNPLFDEVKKLPATDQLVFQFLTALRPGAAFDSFSIEDVDLTACRTCEFVPVPAPLGKPLRELAPNHLQTRLERAITRIAKMPTELLHILVQGAGQPHHPTRPKWRRQHMYSAFFDCLTALPLQSPVVIAESRAYRSDPNDGLLKDVQAMIQLRDQL
jgi:hypothetical protein